MVRWALRGTRKDKLRNKYLRWTEKYAKLEDKLRDAKLRWYGQVKRREESYVCKRMMEMAVPGRRKRWIDLAKENMERVGAKEGDEIDRVKCTILWRRDDPKYGELERRRRLFSTEDYTQI